MPVRLTPCRRERTARCPCRFGGIPTSAATLVAAGGVAAVAAPGAAFGLAAGRTRGPTARAAGVMDLGPAKPALRPRGGQSALAGSLRNGPGRDGQRSRVQRRHSVAPRAARLAGLRAGGAGLEHQGDAPADRHVGRLSPVVAVGHERPSNATPATACSGGRPRRGWRRRWFAMRCSPYRACSIPGWAARAFATRKSSRYRARRPFSTRPSIPDRPGLDRRTLFRAWARGGRSPLLDAFDCPDPSTTAPRRAVTTTPLAGPLPDEQRPGPASFRRLRRTAGARGGPARRRSRSSGLSGWRSGAAPSPTSGRWAERGCPAIRARLRWRGRSSTATNSFTSIERPRQRALMDRRDFFSWAAMAVWPARPPRRSCCATVRLQAGQPGEASPACPHFAPKATARDSHLPVRGDEPCRYV